MDDKKNEASGEELEQLGPYQLQEQVPQSPGSQGELYLATHEASGVTVLVLKPAEEDKVPDKDWRVLLSASASERYVAMQVEQTPWSVSLERQSVESLLFTLEEVQEGVRSMTHALDEPRAPLILRLGLSLASAAAVFALLFALVSLVSGSPPPSGSEPLADTGPVLTSDDAQVAAGTPDADFGSSFLSDTVDAGEPMIVARPLPREPLKGQKRPPCTRYVELEINGACWAPHELKAPCPEALYEYQGKCYLAAFSAKPPPQSLEP